MDKELQTWYENQFDMMAKPGWTDFIEKVSEIQESTSDITTVADAQQLYYRQGQLDIIRWLLGWKETCSKVYEELQNG